MDNYFKYNGKKYFYKKACLLNIDVNSEEKLIVPGTSLKHCVERAKDLIDEMEEKRVKKIPESGGLRIKI